MFDKLLGKERPLPPPVLQPRERTADTFTMSGGIHLGGGVWWNPEALPNPHVIAIGASGSGKTQTLKAMAWELHRAYPDAQIIVIDFHGDQALSGETCYQLHQGSPHGINPLMVNLDQAGGGPNLQAISVAGVCRRALMLGPNQEGALLSILRQCYERRSIFQEEPETWTNEPPTFADVAAVIDEEINAGNREAVKLRLKLAATAAYGIFSRRQPAELLDGVTGRWGDGAKLTPSPSRPVSQSPRLIRLDVSKLSLELGAIAGESLARQVMARHRLLGEIIDKKPRTFLVIDEAKEMPATSGSACDRIIAGGRKYGLALVLASQSERHLSLDVIGNSSTKIVLPVDQTEVRKVANKFRFDETKVAQLRPLQALCRFGVHAMLVEIQPYFARLR